MTSIRKPRTAINLSMLSPGLGHVYCGVIARGLALQVSSIVALILAILGLLAPPPMRLILAGSGIIVAVALTIYAIIDARRQALQTREDYRLKDYNRPLVYVLLAMLTIIVAPLVAFVIRGWVLSAFVIAGDSFFPSLHAGDRVVVDKQAYTSRDPHPGDGIVFANLDDRRKHWVKRVIAVAGDTVEMRDGAVIVNGKELDSRVIESDARDPKGIEGSIVEETNAGTSYSVFYPKDIDSGMLNLAPETVPKNHVYVLGDHRGNSRDSRHLGPISIFSIEGKILMRFWPFWKR